MPEKRHMAKPRPAESAVITKATLRAADRLEVPGRILASVLGLSEATVSRMKRGAFALEMRHQTVRAGRALRAPVPLARCDGRWR